MFQDDEDSISELMVDKDKKSRFKLEKVGQVINIKSFSNTGTWFEIKSHQIAFFPDFDEIVKFIKNFVIFHYSI